MSLTPQGNDYDQAKDPRDRLNREDRSLVVTELLKAGYPVRAMVRREDGRSTRLRGPGAEIAVAEMTVWSAPMNALHDVRRAFPPFDPNEDIARVAAAALMNPARHGGKSYRPTGPELLGAEDMARAISRAVRRSVRAVPTPTWMFLKTARMAGYPIDLLSNLRYYIDDHRRGAFEVGAPTTDVADVTGCPAEDFEPIARRYVALPGNRRTFGNRLRAFARFLMAPLSPGYHFDRYDRELRRFPSKPQFAPESEVWRREHGIGGVAEPPCCSAKGRSRATGRGRVELERRNSSCHNSGFL